MAKTVTLDTLTLHGANIWVDLNSGNIRLEVTYTVSSSTQGVSVTKAREAQELLTQADLYSILDITGRLKTSLEAQELA